MADYKVTDTELTSIANAIRTKSGTSAQLEFPSEFINAINAISGGGSGSYELLEYIESNGTQAIDLGIKTHTNNLMFARVQALSGNTDYKWVLSSWYNSTRYAGIIYADGITRSYDGAGNSEILYNGIDTTKMNTYYTKVNNAAESSRNAQLFAFKDDTDTYVNFSKVKLCFAVVGEVVFLPVRRKSDNVCGVMNINTGAFLPDSAGGDPFVAGSVIF